MDLSKYLSIIEIADSGSFSQAARNLYISQPNLSNQVKKLEALLGYPIFERTRSGAIPTKEGMQLIERMRIAKRECDMIEEMLYSRSIKRPTALHVGALNMDTPTTALPRLINQHIEDGINISLSDYSALSEVLIEIDKLDFAVIGTLSPYLKNLWSTLHHQYIEYHPITDLPVCAFAGKKNPLYYAESDLITLEELKKQTLVQFMTPSTDPQQSYLHVLGLSGRSKGEISVNNHQGFFRMISETAVVGIDGGIPEDFNARNKDRDLRALKLDNINLYWQVGWIKKERTTLSPVALEFLEIVQSMLQ